jgi:hypothetical protein
MNLYTLYTEDHMMNPILHRVAALPMSLVHSVACQCDRWRHGFDQIGSGDHVIWAELRVVRFEVVGVWIVRMLIDERIMHTPCRAFVAAGIGAIETCSGIVARGQSMLVRAVEPHKQKKIAAIRRENALPVERYVEASESIEL